MTAHPETAKSRTVALPNVNKGLTDRQSSAKGLNVAAMVENVWNGVAFGPYLVPLSRRVE
jgi:hypothetical protein